MAHLDLRALAAEMLHTYRTGESVAPPSERFEGFSMADAYAVEAEFSRLRCAEGAKTVGVKVGYANKAMWRVLKIETLVWGSMYDDTVHTGGELKLPYYRNTKIEPEIVFGMREPLSGAGLDAASALKAVEWIALGFELIDAPFGEAQFKPVDFVAAYGLHQALLVGPKMAVTEDTIPQWVEELAKFKVRVFRNGEFVEEGSGKNSLRSPALCLAEVAAAKGLGAGDLLSSGTLTAGHVARGGETWRAEVEGIGCSGVEVRLG